MAVVTISRVLGSGGDEIAANVARNLGYQLVDNALIVKVAERAGVSVDSAASFDEKYQSRAFEWLKNFIEPRVGKILTEQGSHLDPQTFIEYCKTIIRGLAEEGNVVIVGRAGQFILRDFDNAFHVRITAGADFRIKRIMEKRSISRREAADLMKKSDTMRCNYIERYMKADWNDPVYYHIVLDSSKLGRDLAVNIISNAVGHFARDFDYVPGIRDRRTGRDRRQKERRKGERRTTDVGVSQKEITHILVREGRMPRTLSKPDRRKNERRREDRRTTGN